MSTNAQMSGDNLEELVLQSIRKVREVSRLLHPSLLDEAGLETALAQFVEDYADLNRVQVSLEVSPDLARLRPEVELVLFRLVEEALKTVRAKSHSQRFLVTIGLGSVSTDRDVVLTIEGVAEDASAAHHSSPLLSLRTPIGRTPVLEIASMRERLSHVGGHLRLHCAEGRIVVRAIVPSTIGR
jgi:signal transduction histidine kinase